jgi:hypothetical protein
VRLTERRWFQAASGAAALVMGLAACHAAPATADRLIARQKAIDPPQLWLAQVLGEAGTVKGSVFVCADTALREGFTRARAEIDGHPCVDSTSWRVKPNGWTLRCNASGRQWSESSVTVGDLQQDFVVDFALTESWVFNNDTPQSVRQMRRYRHIGACPTGWRIGDQAKPGRRPHSAI